jgi:hypothetical protein
MERIKKINKITISTGYVLLKIKIKPSAIITPDNKSGGPQVDYAEVVSFGPTVDDVEAGDIVLDFRSAETFEWQKEKYAIVPRMNIRFLIKPSNFDHGRKAGAQSKLAN